MTHDFDVVVRGVISSSHIEVISVRHQQKSKEGYNDLLLKGHARDKEGGKK